MIAGAGMLPDPEVRKIERGLRQCLPDDFGIRSIVRLVVRDESGRAYRILVRTEEMYGQEDHDRPEAGGI